MRAQVYCILKGFLTQLARNTKRTFPSIIKHANKKDFRRLIQYTLEIMQRNVKIRPELKRIIRKNGNLFRHLVHPAYSMKSKRRYLIQKGGGKGGFRALFQSMKTPARAASALGVGPPSGSLLRSGTRALSRRQLDIGMRTRGAHHLSPAVSQTSLNTAGLRQSAVNPFTGVPDRPIGLATSSPSGSLHQRAARDLTPGFLNNSFNFEPFHNTLRLKRIGPRGKSGPRMSEAHLRDLRARDTRARDTRALLDTSSGQSSAWSVGREPPRVASRQSLNTSMTPEEFAIFERGLLYTGDRPLSRASSIRSMENLRWSSSTRPSPAGDMFEMRDILAARPITPTVARTTRFHTSTPVDRDLDLIGKRTYNPAEHIAAAMPWPESMPRRATPLNPFSEMSERQWVSRRHHTDEPSFNLLNTPLGDQPIPRLPPPPVPTVGARMRGMWPSRRAPSEPTRSHIAQLDMEGPAYRGQRNPFDATMAAKSPIMEELHSI